jgi:hypothetical protein
MPLGINPNSFFVWVRMINQAVSLQKVEWFLIEQICSIFAKKSNARKKT